MRKRKTKVFAILLSLALIFSTLPASAFAAGTAGNSSIVDSGSCGENTTYTLTDDGTLTIDGTGAVPQEMNWLFDTDDVTTIVIKSPVVKIGGGAFQYFNNLTSVEVEGNTIIGNSAFITCHNLTEVFMPEVTTIEGSTFALCHALRSIYAPKVQSIGEGVFYDTNLTAVTFPELTHLDLAAFSNCKNLQAISMPKLQNVPDQAFMNCVSLTDINLPNVTRISEGSFYGCTILESVYLPELKYAGHQSFTRCYKLKKVNFPSLTETDRGVFRECTALAEVNLPKLTKAQMGLFDYCTSLSQISLPNLESGSSIFGQCPNLTYICLPKIRSFDDTVNCSQLKEIVLDNQHLRGICFPAFPKTTVVHLLMNNIDDPYSDLASAILEQANTHKVVKDIKLTLTNRYDTYVCTEKGCSFTYNNTSSLTPIHKMQVLQSNRGEIYSDKKDHKVFDHGSIEFTFTPENGYYLKNIIIDGVKKSPAKTYTLKDVTKPHTVSAVFEITPEKLIEGVKNTRIIYPKAVKYKKGIKLTWKKTSGYRMDGYQVWRSTSKNSGYKKMIEKTTTSYINTASLKKGRTYWYKIRGYRVINGKRYYTAYRTISIKY